MKRRLNQRAWNTWVKSVGGEALASALIIQTLVTCSTSKADKLAHGRYPSALSYLEQKALSELAKSDIDELFPLVGASRGKAA